MFRKSHIMIAALSIIAMLWVSPAAFATVFGTNITQFDTYSTGPDPWHVGSGYAREDQEVEPTNAIGQAWDMEGFFLNRQVNELTMVGGFNFETGQTLFDQPFDSINNPAGLFIESGDIFVSVDGEDYVIDIDLAADTYDIRKLAADSVLKDVILLDNAAKGYGPYLYVEEADGTLADSLFQGTGLVQQEVDGVALGFSHDPVFPGFTYAYDTTKHYALTFDISYLLNLGAYKYEFDYRMACGNDVLVGVATPEPGTILLLGCGLVGLASMGRRRQKA